MANRNFASGGKLYSMHTMPVLVDCNFVVDSTNGNGLGIRNLKGPLVQNVYMNTSATAAVGNPNPSAGTIVIQLQDNYNRSFSGFNAIVSPVSGTPLTATTIHVPVIIVSLGTATLAQWQAKGLPIGITPAVGVAFVPTASGTIGGSAAVEIAAATGSGVATIETLGDPNTTIAPDPTQNQGFGAQLILQCRDYAGALVAPADGSVISIAMYLSNSSVQVLGE
jgi:hypothetical protein